MVGRVLQVRVFVLTACCMCVLHAVNAAYIG